MSDNLSQDDIDKLMKQNNKSSDEVKAPAFGINESGHSVQHLDESEVDALGEIGNMSMGSAATTLSMLLSNKVDITTPRVVEFKNIKELLQADHDFITVEIKFEEGLDGMSIFTLNKQDSAIIADLMMGGTGVVEKPEIGELQLSAVGEAMNQMIGSASTSMASMFNFPVNISPPIVNLQKKEEELNLSEDIFGVPIIAVIFKFKVGDLIDSEMIQVMSLDSARFQIETLLKSMTAVVEEATQENKAQSGSVNIPQQPAMQQSAPQLNQEVSIAPPPVTPAVDPVTVQPVQFASFDTSPAISGEANKNLDLLMDIKLKLTVELGRSELPIKKVLELTRGSVIELDKIAGEPVELYANGKLIAKGEVVVIEDNFGLRITSITSPDNRISNIN